MTATTESGYAAVFQFYVDLGWPGVIKLKAGTKDPVPAGFTGNNGVDPSYADMHAWAEEEPGGNVALRLPDGFIGIDEDRWGGKTGQQTVEEAERRWGALPPSQKSTSRTCGSGIRIYRVPPGTVFPGNLEFPELGLGGVEFLQRHHRYVMAWPSTHPNGATYEWYDADGNVTNPPHIDDIPDLPAKWVENLRQPDKPTSTAGLGSDGPYNVRQALTEGQPSHRVNGKLGQAIMGCQGGSRHDATRDNVLGLLRCGKQGEPGVLAALTALQKAFVEAVWKDRAGGRDEATTEFRNFINSKKTALLLADDTYDDWNNNVTEVAADTLAANPEVGNSDEPGAVADPYEGLIQHKLQMLRVNKEAQRRLDDEQRPRLELPAVKPLAALLEEPDEDTPWLIDKVMQADSRVMLAAQFKAGKTTIVGNLTRSLADGTPFLGAFEVKQHPVKIVLIDDELSERMLRHWLREQGVTNTAAVVDVVSLRGRVGSFNLLDEHVRAQWAQRLGDVGCDCLILDCLRPILDALGLDENRDAGKFLTAFDALLADAGITSAVMVDHMGHSGERNRGDSRKLDWPDATWKLVRENDQPDSARFFSAYGRDVDVFEGRLAFDPATRHLTYVQGSRSDGKVRAAYIDVIRLLSVRAPGRAPVQGDERQWMSKNSIEGALPGYGENTDTGVHTQKAVRGAIALGLKTGVLQVQKGARGAQFVSIAHPCAKCGLPVVTKRERHESCPADAEGALE